MRPKTLIRLSNELSSLPGISKKQAERLSFYLIKTDIINTENLVESIEAATSRIRKCSICNHITEDEVCDICQDTKRRKVLVIVENSTDVFKFEEAGKLKPHYHVLNGLLNISKNMDMEDLDIDGLHKRASEYKEVILALSPNLEGIVTANYLKDLLMDCKVTQLAQGIPLGAAMEYVDELTLKAAIENRKAVK